MRSRAMWSLLLKWPGRILAIALALAVVGVVFLFVFWAGDSKVEADVVAKQCPSLGANTVTVKTRMLGITSTKAVDHIECLAVRVGSFVEYYVRTGRVVVYDREGGRCITDSASLVC